MHHAGRAESRTDRRTRARSLAGFFAAGAVLSTSVIVLPGWDDLHVAGIWATIVAAAFGSLGLATFAEHVGRATTHAMTGAGTALIAACQVLAGGGSPTAMYAMLYIWVILHCSLFASRTAVAVHLVLTTAAHAAALTWLGEIATIAPQLALTLVTQVSSAMIVVPLAARQRELADTDSLTGLANRRVLDGTLEWSLHRFRRRGGTPPCVALLDLDGFKTYNDRRGHAAGDRLLTEAASAWRGFLRDTDVLARTGGDEFALVLVDTELDDAEQTVRRLLERTPGGVRCSAGIARWDGQETADHLLQRADAALYEAKTDGPVRVAGGAQVRIPRRPGAVLP